MARCVLELSAAHSFGPLGLFVEECPRRGCHAPRPSTSFRLCLPSGVKPFVSSIVSNAQTVFGPLCSNTCSQYPVWRVWAEVCASGGWKHVVVRLQSHSMGMGRWYCACAFVILGHACTFATTNSHICRTLCHSIVSCVTYTWALYLGRVHISA